MHTLYNTAAADYYYQNEKVSTAEVSNENERDGDCQGKTDAHPQEIGLSEGQPDAIVAKGRQQNDGEEYQLKRNNEKCSLLQRSVARAWNAFFQANPKSAIYLGGLLC